MSCDVVRVPSYVVDPYDDIVPYATALSAGSSVVHVISALFWSTVPTETEEMTGALGAPPLAHIVLLGLMVCKRVFLAVWP